MGSTHRGRALALTADWRHPTEIRFGVGRLKELPEVCWRLGLTRPLVVTDRNLARKPFFKRTLRSLDAENIAPGVYAELESEPTGQRVTAGARSYLCGGHDGVICIGGGSALDAGKAISLSAAVGPRAIWSYTSAGQKDHQRPLDIGPIVAVPTTAGTGSEVDANAVITDEAACTKTSLYHPRLLPTVVVADPELTKGMIGYLTAATGADALSHNLEALCSPAFHPILDAVALQGVRYVHDWLPVAFHEHNNLEARTCVMAASIMGAIAFDKGLGAMHGIAHAVGGLFKVQHGRTIAAVMPYVLVYNRRRIEPKMIDLARSLNLPQHTFQALVDWVVDLRLELGLPATLAELGVKPADAQTIAQLALTDGNTASNPVPLDDKKLTRLVTRAIKGQL